MQGLSNYFGGSSGTPGMAEAPMSSVDAMSVGQPTGSMVGGYPGALQAGLLGGGPNGGLFGSPGAARNIGGIVNALLAAHGGRGAAAGNLLGLPGSATDQIVQGQAHSPLNFPQAGGGKGDSGKAGKIGSLISIIEALA